MSRYSANIVTALLAVILLLTGCAACSEDEPTAGTQQPTPTSAAVQTQASTAAQGMHPAVIDTGLKTAQSGDELVFDITAEQFIASFDEQYRRKHGAEYLAAQEKWALLDEVESPYSGQLVRCMRFKNNANDHVDPAVLVYVPRDEQRVIAVAMEFDEHSYAEWAYELYSEHCRCSLMAFLPELDEQGADRLFHLLDDMAYSDRCFVAPNVSPQPKVMYRQRCVGMYSYFRAGKVTVRIVPLTEGYANALQTEGVTIMPIPAQ